MHEFTITIDDQYRVYQYIINISKENSISKIINTICKENNINTPKGKFLGFMKTGLYSNIAAKKKRIAAGSGEKMRKVGAKGAPTAKAFKQSAKTAKKK